MRRHAALLCVAAVLATAPQASADHAPRPQIVDPADDAHFVNGQGLGPLPAEAPPNVAPSIAEMDIRSVTFQTYGHTRIKKVRGRTVRVFTPEGFTVTLKLAAAPLSDGSVYRVVASAPRCDMIRFQLSRQQIEPGASLVYRCNSESGNHDMPIDATVSGSSVIWRVPLSTVSSLARLGEVLTGLRADTAGDTGILTVPRADEAFSGVPYRIGS